MTTFGMPALSDTGQHRRARYERRRRYVTGVPRDAGLHLEPFCFRDDDGCRNFLPLFFGSLDAVANIMDAVEMLPTIGRAGQDVADVGHVELTSAVGRTAGIEVQDDLLVTHRTAADADPLHPVDLLDQQCLGRFYHQPHLGFGPAHFGDLGRVADRRNPAIPEAGLCVTLHRIAREFRGLARLILVEVGEHRADEIALGVVTDLLRDGDQSDAGALQLAAVMF
nr:hypothetical protein [Sphingomonas sp.]